MQEKRIAFWNSDLSPEAMKILQTFCSFLCCLYFLHREFNCWTSVCLFGFFLNTKNTAGLEYEYLEERDWFCVFPHYQHRGHSIPISNNHLTESYQISECTFHFDKKCFVWHKTILLPQDFTEENETRSQGTLEQILEHWFILVMFIEDTFNCLADVLHSIYRSAKRNINTEVIEFHKKSVVMVT